MADKTKNLKLTLTNDTDATTTTFKQWRESINGETDSNMLKIDAFAGTTNAALTNKVDKETGKGLSTNDFTNVDKAKVEAIPADPKYTDTTYTAGEGISISDTNVISATGGGGDVTAAGDNTFTGTNTFNAPTTFNENVEIYGAQFSFSGETFEITGTGFNINNAGGGYISGIDAVPLADDYAANKKYVDDELKLKAGLSSANTFTGTNTFSGTVTVPTPTADNQAATKKYVDDHAGGGSATIGNVTATATSIDSSKPATATATISGNDISFTFGIPKGATGNSGVYLGTTAPTDPSVMVWVNPSGMTIEDGTEVAYG